MPNVVPCDEDTLSGGLRGESGIEISCHGGFSDVVIIKRENSIVVAYDHGACLSDPLSNQDIDTIIEFLNENRPV